VDLLALTTWPLLRCAAGTAFEAAGKGGYSSKLEFAVSAIDVSAGTFKATYVFTNDAVAEGVPMKVISGGGERLLSWMVSSCRQRRHA
jgi:hypothetical protein